MTPDFSVSLANLQTLAPEILLTGAGAVLLLLEAFAPALRKSFVWLAVAAVGGASWLVAATAHDGAIFHGLMQSTPVTAGFAQAALLSAAFGLLAAQGYLSRERLLAGEYPALLLWCTAALLLLLRSVELVSIFLALELLSIGLYGLAAYHRREALSTEAAIKYFLMGAFVSAFLLYGIALVYGETHSTRLDAIASAAHRGTTSPALLTLGLLLIVCAFAFKMSLAPFHAWSPDVYQGAPSPFVAFLSVGPKIASALVVTRFVVIAVQGPLGSRWPTVISILAIVSIAVGNLLALVQRDIKRMLAYSGVAHMGYLIIPLASPGGESLRPMLVYLIAYALMNGGAFAIVAMLYAHPGRTHSIATLSGWGYRFPVLGACLTICMLSLGGIPPTAGFLGKYLVFLHAIEHGHLALALVGIAGSLLGIVYYLRVVYMLYMKPEAAAPERLAVDFAGRLAAIGAALGTLAVGLAPERLLSWIAGALFGA